ncbi:Ribonucleases P/MRP protein subunit POP1 [Vitis vinifera]|uniref:Ribonucleases P/MRP protein subunit POP1 n=1 Tax=Vitis vinifera TaxID=29760 RepID=A0A438JJV7_VITVI|nr:Ribonucleases P/MRP protein subunit POP1 [Vitis vinifera]
MATDGFKRSSIAPPPRSLNVEKFAESRASELEALHSIVANRLNNNFRSQRNKRRRTTGHDNRDANKRFRKREKIGVVDKGNVVTSEKDEKKVPRRIRRRVELRRNTEHGYSTSGDGTKRLRTHVWHAKRFTMTKLWGFYLPVGLQGRGRGSRALLNWFRHGALVHDACYHIALRLEGPEDSLLSILSMVLVPSPSAHSEDISRSVLSGAAYGKAMLHHVGAPGSKSIAPVTYMWRPIQKKDIGIGAEHDVDSVNSTQTNECCSSFRQLWVWMHASAFNEGYDALKFACQKLMDETGILINCFSLEGQLAKLEVMGSKAFGLLRKILHPITCKTLKSWQLTKCSSLDHEDQIPSCAILSLTVDDPRSLPEKKTAVVPEVASNGVLGDASENEAKENTSLKGNQDLDLWMLGMGSVLQWKRIDAQHGSCPILLLKSNNQKGMIGWSIILPLSWVKAFWIPLVSNGAHAIGLREKHWIACEVCAPQFCISSPRLNCHIFLQISLIPMHTHLLWQLKQLHLMKRQNFVLLHASFKSSIPPPWVSVRSAFDKESTILGDTHPCEETCTRDVANEGSFEEGAVVCAPHLSDISMWTSRSRSTETGLQIPQSSVRSYFKEQSSGKWELQIPEDTVTRESNRQAIGFVTTGFVRGSKKLKAGALCEAILLARLREEQWNEMPMKERRKEIYVLVRNLRSTAYRLALATIILEQQEEDVEFM